MQSSTSEKEVLRGMINSFRQQDVVVLLNTVEKTPINKRRCDLLIRAFEILENPPPGVNYENFEAKVRKIFTWNGARSQQNSTTNAFPNAQLVYVSPSNNSNNNQNMQHFQIPNSIKNLNHPLPAENITFTKLPFFENLASIFDPYPLIPDEYNVNTNIHECTFSFRLFPEVCTEITSNRDLSDGKNEYIVQLQLRFCSYNKEADSGVYDDMLPANLSVKLNGCYCVLPRVTTPPEAPEKRRLPRPTNISYYAKLSPNIINSIVINWTSDVDKPTRSYAMTLVVVKKLTCDYLLEQVPIVDSIVTKQVIINKLKVDTTDDEDVVPTTTLLMSLKCPFGATKMEYPAKGKQCLHIQFFDAKNLITLNEHRASTWSCPICSKPLVFDDLEIYQFVLDILHSSNLPNNCVEVELFPDGSWNACDGDRVEIKDTKYNTGQTVDTIEMILDDDDDVNNKEIMDDNLPEIKFVEFLKDIQVVNSEVVDLLSDEDEQEVDNGIRHAFAEVAVPDLVMENNICDNEAEQSVDKSQKKSEVVNSDNNDFENAEVSNSGVIDLSNDKDGDPLCLEALDGVNC